MRALAHEGTPGHVAHRPDRHSGVSAIPGSFDLPAVTVSVTHLPSVIMLMLSAVKRVAAAVASLSAVFALAMSLCAPASAADWVSVPTGDGNQHYYDRSKVFAAGEEVSYWRRVVFATAHPVKNGFARSAMYRERILCKQARITTLGYLLYASDGSVLENVYSPDAEPAAIVPETVGDRFQRIMCAANVTAGDTPPTAPAARETPPKESPAREGAARKTDKADNADEIRQEIDRLEQMLKRLREKLGER